MLNCPYRQWKILRFPATGEASATTDKKGKTDKAKTKKPQSQPSTEEKPEESESMMQLRRRPFVLAMMDDSQVKNDIKLQFVLCNWVHGGIYVSIIVILS